MKIFEKKQKVKEILSRADAIRVKANNEDRARTDEENAEIEELNASAEKWQKEIEQDERLERELGVTGKVTPKVTVKDRFEDDPMRGFKSPREFLSAVIDAGKGRRIPENLKSLTAGSDEQGEYDDVYGGFFVPTAMSPSLLQIKPESDPIASRVQSVPMSSPRISINARVDKDHSSSVSGGLVAYRRAETQDTTVTRAKFEQINLSADSLMGLAYATEELLADSPISFAAIIETGLKDAFTHKLINERLSGTGAGQFLGILNADCLVTVDKESNQTADTINGTNVVKMRARAYNYANSVWMANHDTYVQLCQAHIAGTNSDVFLFNPSRGEDVPDMLLGRPIFFTEYAKTLGDAGDIILADWSQYLEGTYQDAKSESSIHVRFANNETCFKVWVRNAAAPWWSSTLTPTNSTTTLSPFVTLQART